MRKKKKKHWTTKNTHLKRFKKTEEYSEQSSSRFERILYIIGLILAILSILSTALDNFIVGYDHFTGIPSDWIKSLK